MLKPSFKLGDDIERVNEETLSQESSAPDQTLSETERTDQLTDQTSSATPSAPDQPDNGPDKTSSPADNAPIETPSTQNIGTDKADKPVRSSSERTYTFRATPELDDILQQIIEQKSCGKGEAVLPSPPHRLQHPIFLNHHIAHQQVVREAFEF
jgi:hypothetical protein